MVHREQFQTSLRHTHMYPKTHTTLGFVVSQIINLETRVSLIASLAR